MTGQRINFKGIRDYADVAGWIAEREREYGRIMHWGHVPLHLLAGPSNDYQIIAMTRDRRDVVISSAHRMAARTERPVAHFLHEYQERGLWAIGGQEASNDWWDSYAAWHSIVPHILIRYEDLLTDTAGQLRRAWDYFELGEYPPDEEMARIIELRNRPDQPHRRRGVVGEWREWFADEEGAAFYDRHMAYLPEYLEYKRWLPQQS
jgi:hypothetical protein